MCAPGRLEDDARVAAAVAAAAAAASSLPASN